MASLPIWQNPTSSFSHLSILTLTAIAQPTPTLKKKLAEALEQQRATADGRHFQLGGGCAARNLQALLSRLSKICLSRRASAVNAPKFSCASMMRRLFFFFGGCPAAAPANAGSAGGAARRNQAGGSRLTT